MGGFDCAAHAFETSIAATARCAATSLLKLKSRGAIGDKPRSTTERQVLDPHLDENQEPVLECHDVHHVYTGPHNPRNEPERCKPKALATAAQRPITANEPLSKYRKGGNCG